MISSAVDQLLSVSELLSVLPLGCSVVPVVIPGETKEFGVPWDEIQTQLQSSIMGLSSLVHLHEAIGHFPTHQLFSSLSASGH